MIALSMPTITQATQAMEYEDSFLQFCDYLTGQRLYMNLHPIDDCENESQRAGWMDGCKFEGYAETNAWLEAKKVDEVQSEYTDWRS